ncbi:uncharacterized protein LODBEIA_P50890 [Lodderomyces beijingensis]|uniref:Mediator of RNA polymerase II transcription subunit 12 n=1 Tax=Lodderomyces beijingensis TaxID=1775926 RepID=A0ABP0ZUI6_9ASCO
MSSKTKSRNRLLSSHKSTSHSNSSTRDELLQLKYQMEKPALPIYPLEETSEQISNSASGSKTRNSNEPKTFLPTELTYPDFTPWKDHTQVAKNSQDKAESQSQNQNHSYLTKGFFEAPHVQNEYYSGRNLLQATLFLSTENCNKVVAELSQHLASSYKARNETINKIKFDSNHFRIPPRVTLTASRKESWLRDLSNPQVPLQRVGEKIPHGIRNKVLVDSLTCKRVPTDRALWFTKCILYGELYALRRKVQSRMSNAGGGNSGIGASAVENCSVEKYELLWLQDWTQQVADYIFKFSKDVSLVSSLEMKDSCMRKLNYLLDLTRSYYIEALIDKQFFLSFILKPLKDGISLDPSFLEELSLKRARDEDDDLDDLDDLDDGDHVDHAVAGVADAVSDEARLELDYGQRLLSLSFIKMFWNDIILYDYLATEMSGLLLLNYYFITKFSRWSKTAELPESLKSNLVKLITDTVIYLFKYNTNFFVIPDTWKLAESALNAILIPHADSIDEMGREKILKQLELVKYRNESLVLNSKSQQLSPEEISKQQQQQQQQQQHPTPMSQREKSTRNRNLSSTVSRVIESLDSLRLNQELARLLKPQNVATSTTTTNATTTSTVSDWKVNLRFALLWCVSKWRDWPDQQNNVNILIVCKFLKKSVYTIIFDKASKSEFENEILNIIDFMAANDRLSIDKHRLFILINELVEHKLITIASYLRKLIASGVFFTFAPEETTDLTRAPVALRTHLEILQNLPVSNNRQCISILKKWKLEGSAEKQVLEEAKRLLKQDFLVPIMRNNVHDLPDTCRNSIESLNVGSRYLVIGWFTNELHLSISKTTKLIHFTPAVIIALYQLCLLCNNLDVFFETIVPTILQNDSGIVLVYLDGLYLISRLVVKHFKLIKQFSDTTTNITALNTFRLIIQNFIELEANEYNYLDFAQVWQFIDGVVEKGGRAGNNSKRRRVLDPSMEKSSSSSATSVNLETPMQINTVDLSVMNQTPRSREVYTSDHFWEDLNRLRNKKPTELPLDDYKDLTSAVGADDVDKLLDVWYSQVDTISEDDEIKIVKLLKHFVAKDATASQGKIQSFLSSKIGQPDTETLSMLRKLVVFDMTKMSPIVLRCEDLSLLYSLLMDIIGSEKKKKTGLSASQQELFNIHVNMFKRKNETLLLDLITRGLLSGELSPHDDSIIQHLRHCAATEGQLFASRVVFKMQRDEAGKLLGILLGKTGTGSGDLDLDPDSILTLDSFEKDFIEINEFNLTLYQLLLSRIAETLDGVDTMTRNERWQQFVSSLIDSLSLSMHTLTTGRAIFDIFEAVPWTHKESVLQAFENMFMAQAEGEGETPLIFPGNGIFLSSIDGFLGKFLFYSLGKLGCSSEFVQKLSVFTKKLVLLLNEEHEGSQTGKIDLLLSTTLKILILHKSNLCSYIADKMGEQTADALVGQLIDVVKSKYLAESDGKFRILLCDLLLLMKSTVAEELVSKSDFETSPGSGSGSGSSGSGNSGGAGVGGGGNAQISASDDLTSVPRYPGSTATLQVQELFDLPTMNEANIFKDEIDASLVNCSIMLDRQELDHGGDFHVFNNSGIKVCSSRVDSFGLNSFVGNILSSNKHHGDSPSKQNGGRNVRSFKMKSYEILEDTSTSSSSSASANTSTSANTNTNNNSTTTSAVNDACINLSLLDAYATKENPL